MTTASRQPMTKRALTTTEHRALGQRLHQMRETLIRERLPYAKASRVSRKLRRALQAIDSLRCELDRLHANEAGDDFEPKCYFPGSVSTAISPGRTGR
jgi:hypothetical protein